MVKRTMRKGFTLVELLIVIAIIVILMALLVVFIKGTIDRARNNKSRALIDALSAGCQAYHVDFAQYPPMTKTKSASLHWYLGQKRDIIVTNERYGPNITTTKPPYIEFRKEWLEPSAAGTYPVPTPYLIYDAWEKVVEYANPGTDHRGLNGADNRQFVDIFSPGKNGTDESGLSTGGDDISNWRND